MRCVSIGAVVIAGMLAGSDITGIAGPSQRQEVADTQIAPAVDVELAIAVDVSYSMDLEELAVQREGYAQAIVSKDGRKCPGRVFGIERVAAFGVELRHQTHQQRNVRRGGSSHPSHYS